MRIALVPHTRDWSYDLTARALAQHLDHEIRIFYGDTLDTFNPLDFDLAVDFWWRATLDRRLGQRVIKQVSSHRWGREKYGSLDAAGFVAGHLSRSGALLVPSERLRAVLSPYFEREVTVCPKGFHHETFGDHGTRRGPLAVGWVGNAAAIDKRIDIIRAAWPRLRAVGPGTPQGQVDQAAMPAFYNALDVITCASDAEGDPRPLIEGMACGCFPVVVDVGIVPELVRHGENGLIVERTPEAFDEALRWCRDNLEYVREAGKRNAEEMLRTRTWKLCAAVWGGAFERAIARAPEWKINAREERKARILAARKKRARERAEASR